MVKTEQVEINGKSVPVSGAEEFLQLAIDSAKFKDWVARLDPRFTVDSIEVQSVDVFGSRGVGFLKINPVVRNEAGNVVPAIAFIRGGCVAILVILECDGRDYVLLTTQARPPICAYDYHEIPAGMLDGDGKFSGVAAKELQQETGIELSEGMLYDLTDMIPGELGIYPSAGGSDEFIRYYVYRESVTRQRLGELQGRLTGVPGENEYIALEVMPLSTACGVVSDGKFWTALGLYYVARGQGRR